MAKEFGPFSPGATEAAHNVPSGGIRETLINAAKTAKAVLQFLELPGFPLAPY
jgi:hypothetical protein